MLVLFCFVWLVWSMSHRAFVLFFFMVPPRARLTMHLVVGLVILANRFLTHQLGEAMRSNTFPRFFIENDKIF